MPDLKASRMIVMCSYGENLLPTAMKFQFYMNTDAFLSANLLGLLLVNSGTHPQISIKLDGVVL